MKNANGRRAAGALMGFVVLGLSCGGPGNGGPGQINEPPDDGGGPYNVFGYVELPAGAGALSDYRVLGLRQSHSVGTDGSFAVFTHTSGINPVWLVDQQGRVSLAGLLDSHTPLENRLSTTSTAVVLLFYALGGPALPPEWQEAMVESLYTHAETAKLATAIASAYAADRGTFDDPDSPILDALQDALASAPPTTADPVAAQNSRGFVEIDPEGTRDGILVDSDEAPQLTLTNNALRSAIYYLYRTGYETSDISITLDPPERVGSGPLPARFEVNLEEQQAWLGYWIGNTAELIEDSAELPGRVEEELAAEEDQLVVHYELVVAGGHIPGEVSIPDWWTASDNPDKQEWLEESQHLPALGLVKGAFLPAVYAMLLSFGEPPAPGLTGAEADAFLDEIAPYTPNVRASLDAGEWDAAVREMLAALAEWPTVRAAFDERLNGWLGGDTRYTTADFWAALQGGEVYLQALAAGIKLTDIAGVVESHRGAEMMQRWSIDYQNSKLALSAIDDTVDPSSEWAEIQARLDGAPANYCVRYTLSGPGCLLPADEYSCAGSSNQQLLTTDTAVHYIVNDLDIVEGTEVTVTAEYFESACDDVSGAPRNTDSVTITHHEFPDPEPCDPNDFDLAWWQTGLGYTVQTAGTLGGRISVTVNFSAPQNDPARVDLFMPGARGVRTSEITVFGGGDRMQWSAQYFGAVYLDVRRDEAGMPVKVPGAMHVTVTGATSPVTVTCPSNAFRTPECPYVVFDQYTAEQLSLTGPIVGIELSGHPATFDVVRVPEE